MRKRWLNYNPLKPQRTLLLLLLFMLLKTTLEYQVITKFSNIFIMLIFRLKP